MKKQLWHSLEHKIWKQHASWPSMKRLLVGFSGGADSVVLLSVFSKLASVMKVEIVAAHVHHGVNENQLIEKAASWRDEAQKFCINFADKYEIKIILGGPSTQKLESEESLRNFRYQELNRIREEEKCDFILTAHHADDLLETRLLRLMRGTGPTGLEALKDLNFETHLWRPFLTISKKEILNYIHEQQLSFIEDPSNQSLDPTRNWLRNELIPQLDKRQKGMSENLSRSLQLIVDEITHQKSSPPLTNILSPQQSNEIVIDRAYYCALSSLEQRHHIAQILIKLGIKNYTQGQIKEVQKRLDNSQRVHTFTIAAAQWRVDARQIYINNN